MTKYKFDIIHIMKVIVDADTVEEAKKELIKNPDCYGDNILNSDYSVSEGELFKKES